MKLFYIGKVIARGIEDGRSPPNPLIIDSRRKFHGSMILADKSPNIIIPTVDEWIGISLLERDDEMYHR